MGLRNGTRIKCSAQVTAKSFFRVLFIIIGSQGGLMAFHC